jgi:hypothetical protein
MATERRIFNQQNSQLRIQTGSHSENGLRKSGANTSASSQIIASME